MSTLDGISSRSGTRPPNSPRQMARRFGVPGTGNPNYNGWKAGGPALLFKGRLTKYLSEHPEEIEKVLLVLVQIATGKAPEGVRITAKDIVMAAREIMDRTEGKPLQSFAAAANTKVVIHGLEDDDDGDENV